MTNAYRGENSMLRELCTEVRTSSGYFKGKKLYVQGMSRGRKCLLCRIV